MTPPAGRSRVRVLDIAVDAVSRADALARIAAWASAGAARYVCFCNVHTAVTASGDRALRGAIERCDLACPDGSPIAWTLRRRGVARQDRVSGPDVMLDVCAWAHGARIPVFLFGSTGDTLARLARRLGERFPGLAIAGTLAPPFAPPTAADQAAAIGHIRRSGARVVFVGLGCPRQETWMAAHSADVPAVMLGVGAAFDFHAGVRRRAPAWMQRFALEWLFRLAQEPARLGPRYLVTNAVFLWRLAQEALRRRTA